MHYPLTSLFRVVLDCGGLDFAVVDNMSRFHTGGISCKRGVKLHSKKVKLGKLTEKNIRWGAMSDPENEKRGEKRNTISWLQRKYCASEGVMLHSERENSRKEKERDIMTPFPARLVAMIDPESEGKNKKS